MNDIRSFCETSPWARGLADLGYDLLIDDKGPQRVRGRACLELHLFANRPDDGSFVEALSTVGADFPDDQKHDVSVCLWRMLQEAKAKGRKVAA